MLKWYVVDPVAVNGNALEVGRANDVIPEVDEIRGVGRVTMSVPFRDVARVMNDVIRGVARVFEIVVIRVVLKDAVRVVGIGVRIVRAAIRVLAVGIVPETVHVLGRDLSCVIVRVNVVGTARVTVPVMS